MVSGDLKVNLREQRKMSDFNEKYYENYNGQSVASYVNDFIYASADEMKRMEKVVEQIPTEATTILDVGAGHGVFLELLEKSKAIKGVGIEITDSKVDYATGKGIDVRKGSADKLEFPDNSFDAVVCMEVIEHLPFEVYEKTLRELQRVAKKYVIISVPYQEERRFVKCPYCKSSSNPSLHMRSYTDNDMKTLFEEFSLLSLTGEGKTISYPRLLNSLKQLIPTEPSTFFLCPVCGYTKNEKSKITASRPNSLGQASPWYKRVIRALFAGEKSRWYLAVYQNKQNLKIE